MTPTPTTAAPDPVRALTRPIIGIENRTAIEVFAIMADRIRRAMQEAMSAQGGGEAVSTWKTLAIGLGAHLEQLEAHCAVKTGKTGSAHVNEGRELRAAGAALIDMVRAELARPAPEVKDATGEEWRNDEPPKSGVPFHGMDVYSMRWTPYSKKSDQYKRGLRGRWQRAKEHGGWENCELPSAWRPDSQYFSGGRADD